MWGKATILLGKHSARKFLFAPLKIWGEGLTVSFFYFSSCILEIVDTVDFDT